MLAAENTSILGVGDPATSPGAWRWDKGLPTAPSAHARPEGRSRPRIGSVSRTGAPLAIRARTIRPGSPRSPRPGRRNTLRPPSRSRVAAPPSPSSRPAACLSSPASQRLVSGLDGCEHPLLLAILEPCCLNPVRRHPGDAQAQHRAAERRPEADAFGQLREGIPAWPEQYVVDGSVEEGLSVELVQHHAPGSGQRGPRELHGQRQHRSDLEAEPGSRNHRPRSPPRRRARSCESARGWSK